MAWSILGLSVVAFVSIVSTIWRVPDKPSALLGALVLLWEGIGAVQAVENEVDDEQ